MNPLFRWAAACFAISACIGCSSPRQFEFGVIGDAPYTPAAERQLRLVITDMNRSNLEFVVHVGDIQADGRRPVEGGIALCTEASLQHRKALFNTSQHAFILTPGDNDWTDCYRADNPRLDPLEQLGVLRALFFADEKSLGEHKIILQAQSTRFPENRIWSVNGVIFATLHMVGSNNNRGRTAAMDAEYSERNAATLAWLEHAFVHAQQQQAAALVLITQANPLFERAWGAAAAGRLLLGLTVTDSAQTQPSGFEDFLTALEQHTLTFAKPVLLIHGDTHVFRLDKPLLDRQKNRLVANFTRLETFGDPDVHWIKVIVDPKDPAVFAIKPQMVAVD